MNRSQDFYVPIDRESICICNETLVFFRINPFVCSDATNRSASRILRHKTGPAPLFHPIRDVESCFLFLSGYYPSLWLCSRRGLVETVRAKIFKGIVLQRRKGWLRVLVTQ